MERVTQIVKMFRFQQKLNILKKYKTLTRIPNLCTQGLGKILTNDRAI